MAEADLLRSLIKRELWTLPLDEWGHFFPAMVAVWRFIQETRPGVLGELEAGYDGEPWFKGKGAHWFLDDLWQRDDVLSPVETIMYAAVDGLNQSAKDRGFLKEREVPDIDAQTVAVLASSVLAATDRAVQAGAVK